VVFPYYAVWEPCTQKMQAWKREIGSETCRGVADSETGPSLARYQPPRVLEITTLAAAFLAIAAIRKVEARGGNEPAAAIPVVVAVIVSGAT
jgi:hypothetical protein